MANSVDHDQTAPLGLHCLHMYIVRNFGTYSILITRVLIWKCCSTHHLGGWEES